MSCSTEDVIKSKAEERTHMYCTQGWVFAMAKTIFAGTVEKTGKNWQNQRHHKLITDFITHILQAAFEPYYNSGKDSEHK